MAYIIGRSYGKHGITDYYAGKDGDGNLTFSGKNNPALVKYTNLNMAYGMSLRLQRLLPTIVGGSPASYRIVEIE